jgi:hypothetical protein
MRRREFMAFLGAAAASPLGTRAQPGMRRVTVSHKNLRPLLRQALYNTRQLNKGGCFS